MDVQKRPYSIPRSPQDSNPSDEVCLQQRPRFTLKGLRSLFGVFHRCRSTLGILVENGWVTLARCSGTPPVLEKTNALWFPGKALLSPECLTAIRNEIRLCPPGTHIWFRLDESCTETLHTTIQAESCTPEEAFAMLLARQDGPQDAAVLLFQYRLDSPSQRLFQPFHARKDVQRHPLAVLAADKHVVHQWRRRLEESGIRPQGFTDTIHCLENLYASGWLESPWDCFALAEITESGTHLVVFERKKDDLSPRLISSRTFRTGARELLEKLRQQEVVSEENLNAALHRLYLPATSPEEARALEEDLRVPLQRLGQQLQHETAPDKRAGSIIQGLLVAGPEGGVESAVRFFGESTSLPCRALALTGKRPASSRTSLQNLSRQQTPSDSKPAASDLCLPPPPFLQTIGLALSSQQITPNVLFGFQEQRERKRYAFRIRSVLTGMAVLLLFFVGFAGKGITQLLEDRVSLERLQKELAGWEKLVTLEDLETGLKETEQVNVGARSLARRRFPAAILSEIAALTPPGIRLASVTLTLPLPEPLPPSKTSQTSTRVTPKNKAPTAVLSGITTGDTLQRESGLATFLASLEQCPVVVSLLIEKHPAEGDSAAFTATARLSLP